MRDMFNRRNSFELGFLALCMATALFACLWYRFPLLDDSYICFRYARNLVRGEGLVYNPGEYVEGYTTLLWVLLLAPAFLLDWNVEVYASTLGILAALGCVLIVWLFSHRRNVLSSPLSSPLKESANPAIWIPAFAGMTNFRGSSESVTPAEAGVQEETPIFQQAASWIAVLFVATNSYLAYWSGKGMETPLFVFLLTGGALAVANRFEGKGNGWSWGLWFGLASVTRPEAILFGLFAASCVFIRSPSKKEDWKQAFLGTALAVTPFLLQLIWRLWYYGDPLPNTFYAKVDSNAVFYARGFEYLLNGLQAQPLAAIGFVSSTLLCHRLSSGVRFLVGLSWLGLASVVVMGGDHFHGFRMIVPFVPILYLLLQEVVSLFAREYTTTFQNRWELFAGVMLVALFVRGSFCLHHRLLNDYNTALAEDMNDRRLYGGWIADHSDPGDWIATAASGLLPYVADRPNIDCLGLTDRHIAHLDVELGEGYPGHEKGDGPYVLSRKPRFILPDHRLAPKAYYSEDFRYMFAGRTGLNFLQMPELDQWYALRAEKIGPKFLHVYERRKEKVANPEKRSTIDLERLKAIRPVDWNG